MKDLRDLKDLTIREVQPRESTDSGESTRPLAQSTPEHGDCTSTLPRKPPRRRAEQRPTAPFTPCLLPTRRSFLLLHPSFLRGTQQRRILFPPFAPTDLPPALAPALLVLPSYWSQVLA